MIVCFFGSYDPMYARNKILIDGLVKNGVKVFHCRDTSIGFARRYLRLTMKFFRVGRSVDVIYVGFRGHEDMALAWLLGKIFGKKIVFDAFISIYDTYLYDRRIIKKGSLKAWMFYWIDKLDCLLANKVVLETKTHIEYFCELFGLPKETFACVYVGGDDSVFHPLRKRPRDYVEIEFHGVFTRLHGIEMILEAMKLLENEKRVRLLLIGKSIGFSLSPRAQFLLGKGLPKNAEYHDYLPIERLARRIARCDITIGHFGNTRKAQSVLTNKIFHGLAVRNAVIVADTPVSKEVFKDGQEVVMAKLNDPKDLSNKIMLLVRNHRLRLKIAECGYVLHRAKFSNRYLGSALLEILQKVKGS